MKNKRIKNGNIVLHGEIQGPAVATGTTVTSANSGAAGGNIVRLPCIPRKQKRKKNSIYIFGDNHLKISHRCVTRLTCAICKIRLGTKGSATCMTWTKICQTIVSANRLDIRHTAFTTKVACGSKIYLKGFRALCTTVKVRNSGPSHFYVLAAKEK